MIVDSIPYHEGIAYNVLLFYVLWAQAMESLGWIGHSEDKSDSVSSATGKKIVCIGYSSGAALAYECTRVLQQDWNVRPDDLHFVSLGGPDRNVYETWQFLSPGDRSLEAFVQYHVKNMGRMNPLFDMDAVYVPTLFAVIMEVFHRGKLFYAHGVLQ